MSSVKWSDPGHFLKSQGKFFCHFHVPFFYIFLTPKITDEILKKFPGSLHFTLLSFVQYVNNYLGLSNFYTRTQNLNNYLGQLSKYAYSNNYLGRLILNHAYY